MSFFFTKAKDPRKAPRGTGGRPKTKGAPTPGQRQNAPTLHRLGCKACPLNTAPVDTPKMVPTLRGGPVYFMAEAPGKHEDENSHKALTGPAGMLLKECIPDGEAAYCSFDNTINCRPPDNRTPTFIEVECCRPRRWQYVNDAKPKLIVGLGIVPMQAMLNSSDMQGMRGRLFAVNVGGHKCWFLPTYHPSWVTRLARNKQRPLNSMLGHCFRMDLKRVFEIVDGLDTPIIDSEDEIRANIQCFDGTGADHFQKVMKLIEEAREAPLKSIDLETRFLRPYTKGAGVMTAALSFRNVNFAFAIDHPQSGFSKEQRKAILAKLKILLQDDTIKVAHNAPFEVEWLIWLLGLDTVNHAAWECTQVQAHILDERRGKQAKGGDDSKRAAYQKLDFLVKQHFGISYKSLFKLNKKDMSLSPLGEVLIYNGCDTKYTLRLHHRQTKLLKKAGMHDAYLEAVPRQPTVAIMQFLGISVDQPTVKKFQDKLEGEIKGIVAQINDLKVVKKYIQDKGEFNPAGEDAVIVFRDYLKRPEVVIKEEHGTRYSIDKAVLAQIDHPLAQLLPEYRNRTKLKSTYVDGLELGSENAIVFPDGSLHTNFNTTFAETGRTSSDEPNMQNFPKRLDAWIREEIVPDKGHILLAFDYGQLEGCTAAMCTKDKVLVKALWEDYDIHMEWATRTAKKYPPIVGGERCIQDKAVMKKFRGLIKNKLVFPAIFGAKTESIHGYLTVSTGIDIPITVVDSLMEDFWSQFHGLGTWQDKLMKWYYEYGWVATPTGRRRHYPMTRNQAINHPIQGVACDIVCDAMCRMSHIAASTGRWYLHPRLNIHDDLTFSVPNDDKIIDDAIQTIYRTMLTPPYKFVNVPISVEASVGPNWFQLEEVGKFWSHKDL